MRRARSTTFRARHATADAARRGLPVPVGRTTAVAVVTVLAALGCAGTAGAHVQLTPTTVAPGDPVEFTVLVPSERQAHTTRVDLKLPEGVIPFAYGETPGWKRTLVSADNGAVERVVWTGKLAEDGFAAFRFLAGTPERPTTLTWKALQTYDDGTVARWIGTPKSESPAPVTRVVAGAPRQNAGGEGAGSAGAGSAGAGDEAGADAGASDTSATDSAPSAASTTRRAVVAEAETDWTTRGIAIAAVLVAFAGLAVVLVRPHVR